MRKDVDIDKLEEEQLLRAVVRLNTKIVAIVAGVILGRTSGTDSTMTWPSRPRCLAERRSASPSRRSRRSFGGSTT